MSSAEVMEIVPPFPDTFSGRGILIKFTEGKVEVALPFVVATTAFSLLKLCW